MTERGQQQGTVHMCVGVGQRAGLLAEWEEVISEQGVLEMVHCAHSTLVQNGQTVM